MKKSPPHVEMDALVQQLYVRVDRNNAPKLELNKPVKEECDPHIKVMEATDVETNLVSALDQQGSADQNQK